MAASPDFRLPAGVRPIAISAANLQLLFDQGRSFEEYFQYLEEQNYVDAQAGLLVPEAIETLPEAEEAAEEADNEENTEGAEDNENDGGNEVGAQYIAPAQPSETPEEKPTTATPSPTPAPATPAPQPAKPAPAKPAPAPIEPGSEGDDPLLEE